MKILKALKHTGTLRKLYISNNNITDEVVDDIIAVISCLISAETIFKHRVQ